MTNRAFDGVASLRFESTRLRALVTVKFDEVNRFLLIFLNVLVTKSSLQVGGVVGKERRNGQKIRGPLGLINSEFNACRVGPAPTQSLCGPIFQVGSSRRA